MRISDWSSDVCSSDLRRRSDRFVRPHRATPSKASTYQSIRSPNESVPACAFAIAPGASSSTSRRRAQSCANRSRENVFVRSEEHTSELQSLMRISYAVFCLKKKNNTRTITNNMHLLVTPQYNILCNR